MILWSLSPPCRFHSQTVQAILRHSLIRKNRADSQAHIFKAVQLYNIPPHPSLLFATWFYLCMQCSQLMMGYWAVSLRDTEPRRAIVKWRSQVESSRTFSRVRVYPRSFSCLGLWRFQSCQVTQADNTSAVLCQSKVSISNDQNFTQAMPRLAQIWNCHWSGYRRLLMISPADLIYLFSLQIALIHAAVFQT